jgi:hypothetical protein
MMGWGRRAFSWRPRRVANPSLGVLGNRLKRFGGDVGRRGRILALSVVMGWLLGATAISAQEPPPSSLDVATPVHGYFVFVADNRLLLLDTYTGDLRLLEELRGASSIYDLHWDLQGETIVYRDYLVTKTLEPFTPDAMPSLVIDNRDRNGVYFSPQSWSPDGSRILGFMRDYNIDISIEELQVVYLNGDPPIILRHDVQGKPFAENSQLRFYSFGSASWNPVFNEWIVIQINVIQEQTVFIVYNYVTGEEHILDEAPSSFISFIPIDSAWSPDGRRLIMSVNYLEETRTEIVKVLDENGNFQFQSGETAHDTSIFRIVGWLGVEDLLILRDEFYNPTHSIYLIGQIIDGKWFTTEFFSIPIYEVSDARFPSVGAGSWHLAADEAERARLSCLFDQTLPARLGVGMRGQTTYPLFGASYLRADPGMESETVTWMAERTPFEVIGGAYCKDGFRWLELRLDDGTTGWSAEADGERYFLEPTG